MPPSQPNILTSLADNTRLLDAVKDVFVKQFSLDVISMEQNNEEMGQVVRARLVGLSKVESAIREILTHKTFVIEKDTPMLGR
jgi:hypothetical protein